MKKLMIRLSMVFFGVLAVLTYFSGAISYQLLPVVTATDGADGSLSENLIKDAYVEYSERNGVYASGELFITDILVNTGDFIKAGTPLIQFDRSTFHIQKSERELEITKAEHEWESLNYEYRNFRGNWREKKVLANQMKEKEKEKEIAQAKYDAFVKNIDDDGKLICQMSGKVVTITAEKGKMLEKGAEIIQLTKDDENKNIVFEMNQDEKNNFPVGTEFQIKYMRKAPNQNNEQETEVLSGIVDKIIYEEREKRYIGYGSYTEQEHALEYGEKVRIELKTNGAKYETIVPISSVIESDSGKCIYILREDEKGNYYVKKKKVSVLDSNDYLAAIDVNLEYRDKIITSTSKSLKDDIQVRLQ